MSDMVFIVENKEALPKAHDTKIHFREFGRIKSASLKVVPLTILVGRNNTGKSYAAYLLWSLRNLRENFLRGSQRKRMAPPHNITEFVRHSLSSNVPGSIKIDHRVVQNHINGWLDKNRQDLVKNLLSFNDASISALSIEMHCDVWLRYRVDRPAEFNEWGYEGRDTSVWDLAWHDHGTSMVATKPEFAVLSGGASENIALDMVLSTLLNKMVLGRASHQFQGATYVPAARTGLMLALPSLYANLIENLGLNSADNSRSKLPLPTLRFIQSLTRDSHHSRSETASIADFLETEILKGSILRDNANVTSYNYQPLGTKQAIPLYVASSMVSELAPILSLLRYSFVEGGLVLEEPEAHLHLSAQRAMARGIVRLVNSGIPVVLTTHSDTFLQQINFLLQLGNHPDKVSLMERYGYQDSEILNADDAEAYEFESHDEGTFVKEAKKTPQGFVIRSINETLLNIAREAAALD